MQESFAIKTLFQLSSESLRLCKELSDVLALEKENLVKCHVDGLSETTLRKEQLTRSLAQVRNALKGHLMSYFGQGNLHEQLGERQAEWLTQVQDWNTGWSQLADQCRANQRLMSHSLRNFGVLSDNVKRLLGESTTYSAQGKRVDSGTEGRVVEAKY